VAAAGAALAGGFGGVSALTAAWHDPDSLARLRLRQSKASLPPGCTAEQSAMKSEWQEARTAPTWSCEGYRARALDPPSSSNSAATAGVAFAAVAVNVMVSP
jgi:hypothetical protein